MGLMFVLSYAKGHNRMLFDLQLFCRQLFKKAAKKTANVRRLMATQRLCRASRHARALVSFVNETSLKLTFGGVKISYFDLYLRQFFVLDFVMLAQGGDEGKDKIAVFLRAVHKFFNLIHLGSWSECEYQLAVAACEMMQLVRIA
jgi:hypothetical protein